MYQGSFVFTWNLDSGRYWVVRTSLLREPDQGTPWHPARHERNAMRRLAPPLPTHPPVRKLTNLSVLKGLYQCHHDHILYNFTSYTGMDYLEEFVNNVEVVTMEE
jgi:hypothetical protein